jgi:perosamine synthetase
MDEKQEICKLMCIMIKHSKPSISNKESEALRKVINSGYIGQGTLVKKLETTFAKYIGVKYAIAVNSGTSALHLSLLALGVNKKSEVIIPSYTCSAVLNAVNYTQAKVILADINEPDFNISFLDTKKKITKRTRAIIVPHIFGYPADIKKFASLGIPIIEDCAQSLGASIGKRKAGSFGTASIFSFYATKMISTGYGGMIATNDKKLAYKIMDLREFDNRDNYITRYNYQMSDLEAALGLSQLKQLPGFLKRRTLIANRYNNSFPSATFRQEAISNSAPSHYRYIIGIKNASDFIRQMRKNQVEIKKPIYKPLHKYLGLAPRDFPVTEKVYKMAVSLPIYPSLTDKEINFIIKSGKGALR